MCVCLFTEDWFISQKVCRHSEWSQRTHVYLQIIYHREKPKPYSLNRPSTSLHFASSIVTDVYRPVSLFFNIKINISISYLNNGPVLHTFLAIGVLSLNLEEGYTAFKTALPSLSSLTSLQRWWFIHTSFHTKWIPASCPSLLCYHSQITLLCWTTLLINLEIKTYCHPSKKLTENIGLVKFLPVFPGNLLSSSEILTSMRDLLFYCDSVGSTSV